MNDFDEWNADDWLNTYHHQFEDDDRFEDDDWLGREQ